MHFGMEINHFVTSTTFWKWDGQLLLIVRNKSAKFILQTSTNYTPLLQNSNEIYQLYTAQLLIERPQKHYSMSRICWRDTKPALRSVPPWHRKSRASLSLSCCVPSEQVFLAAAASIEKQNWTEKFPNHTLLKLGRNNKPLYYFDFYNVTLLI